MAQNKHATTADPAWNDADSTQQFTAGIMAENGYTDKKHYHKPDRDEMEHLLFHLMAPEFNFKRSRVDAEWGEYAYDAPAVPGSTHENADLFVRVISTVSQGSDEARAKGSDAIRTQLIMRTDDHPAADEIHESNTVGDYVILSAKPHTKRIPTYGKNVARKVRELRDNVGGLLKTCPDHNVPMIRMWSWRNEDYFAGCPCEDCFEAADW